MFEMIEVIGSSSQNYSEAVKGAVDQLLQAGQKVHFFEVIEQRGAVRDGKFKEFQVKLKVAVACSVAGDGSEAAAMQEYHCVTCNKTTQKEGHLCSPVPQKDKACDWCGSLIPDERHQCSEKIKHLLYICNSCGRTAVRADLVCRPKKVEQ